MEAEGHQTIAIGRAICTIERVDHSEAESILPELKQNEFLKLSIYSDPDVSGTTIPDVIYFDGGREGFSKAFHQVQTPRGDERIFELSKVLVRSDF